MKEGNVINTLIKQLENYQVISIVGNIKNAGKTTVLNYLLSNYKNKIVGVTSIGLDGEKIDQITFLPKPRIYVYAGMFVATAEKCLKECEATYEVVKKTNVKTSLGEILIIKIIKEGNCLVAGPSSLGYMQEVIEQLKQLKCQKILLDGAFSRTTLARLADATILAVGASFSQQIEKTVNHAQNIVKLFELPKFEDKYNLTNYNEIILINSKEQLIFTNQKSTLNCGEEVIKQITKDIKYVYIPKAVSQSFIKTFIENRNNLNCDLIVKRPTNLLLNEQLLNHLFKLKQKIYVIEPVNLVALTYNPFSVKGNVSVIEFGNALKEKISLPIYNVLEKSNKDE